MKTKAVSQAVRITLAPVHINRQPLNAHSGAALADYFNGDSESPVYNVEGSKVAAPVVVMRSQTSAWRIVVRLGGKWFELGEIGRGDPAIESLSESGQLQAFGPPQHEIEKEREIEAARLAQLAEDKAYWDARRQRRIEAAKRRDEKAERARTDARVRMGISF